MCDTVWEGEAPAAPGWQRLRGSLAPPDQTGPTAAGREPRPPSPDRPLRPASQGLTPPARPGGRPALAHDTALPRQLGAADTPARVPGPEVARAGVDAHQPDVARPLRERVDRVALALALLPRAEVALEQARGGHAARVVVVVARHRQARRRLRI